MLYAFFWVIPRRLEFICRRFGTLCLFHLHRNEKWYRYHFSFLVHSTHIYLPMKMEQTECSETSAYKLQTPGNYPKESIQHTEHGESLKSRMGNAFFLFGLWAMISHCPWNPASWQKRVKISNFQLKESRFEIRKGHIWSSVRFLVIFFSIYKTVAE